MKKNFSKFLSILLAIVTVFSFTPMLAGAADSLYPESEHHYQNNFVKEWYYEHPEKVEGLYVTFSDKTSFDDYPYYVIKGDGTVFDYERYPFGPAVWQPDYISEPKNGDYLSIYTDPSEKDSPDCYTGSDLAGKTIYIEGSHFYITLETDEYITAYGFKIDRIADTPPEDVAVITYNICEICGNKAVLIYGEDEEIYTQNFSFAWHKTDDCPGADKAFIGWVNEEGELLPDYEPLDFASAEFKAEYIPLLLGRSEVFGFRNDYESFDIDPNGKYFMNKEDKRMAIRNLFKAFPAFVSLPLTVGFLSLSNTEWIGSCYGMSTAVFLQHYGVIDLLDGTEATCVRDLTATPDLVSTINYYQCNSYIKNIGENLAFSPVEGGSEEAKIEYSKQLKNMFESVENGNIVMFGYYTDILAMTGGHSVLLTGAYTASDGTHVLIAYDNNYAADYNGNYSTTRFYIDPDFTEMNDGLEPIDVFSWTDDYNHFKVLNKDGNSDYDKSEMNRYFFEKTMQLIRSLFT